MRHSLKLLLGLSSLTLTYCQTPAEAPSPEPASGPTSAAATSCLLTSANEQVERNGAFANLIDRRFTYTNGQPASQSERSETVGFALQVRQNRYRFEYQNGLLSRAVDSVNLVVFSYGPGATLPTQAVYSRSGRQRSVFTLAYTAQGRLQSLKEARQVLPTNSNATEQEFTFAYDGNNNVVNERVRFTFSGGRTSERQTDYTFSSQPSPYLNVPNRAALTVLALTGEVETAPAQFWNSNTPSAYTAYEVSPTGTRTPTEAATFTGQYDASNKLTLLAKTSTFYSGGSPTSFQRRTRQSFGYQCQ